MQPFNNQNLRRVITFCPSSNYELTSFPDGYVTFAYVDQRHDKAGNYLEVHSGGYFETINDRILNGKPIKSGKSYYKWGLI